MSFDGIFEKLQTIFNKLFVQSVELEMETSAQDLVEWDSLMQLSIVVAVECEFSVKFRTGEVEMTKNIKEFITLIQRHLAEKDR